MVDSKIIIYIGREALESIIIFDEEYPNLHQILRCHSVICIDLSNEELDDILSNTENDLSTFCLKNDIKIIALKHDIDSFKMNQELIIDKPSSMFFFDISEDEAKKLSSKYGIIVQSEKYINDNVLQLNFYKQLEKGETIPGTLDGWSNILSNVSFPPFNSLVITDDYLLKNKERDKNIGFENLKLLLKAILPKELDTQFHLLIITPMDGISSDKADRLNGMLKSYLRTIRNYDFNVEFIFRDTLHARKAYGNYFVIVCDKGFKMFKAYQNNIAHEDINDIRVLSILHDPKNSMGDSILKTNAKDLSKIRKLCDELTLQIKNGVTNQSRKIIGDTNKDKSVRNRLIN